MVVSATFADAQQKPQNRLVASETPLALPLATVRASSSTLPDAPSATPNPAVAPAVARTLVLENVEVHAQREVVALSPDAGFSQHAEAREVALAAGAYNDIPRYLQTMPGVAFDSDARNTYMVNGGNTMENLFVLDGVEMSNISHIGGNGSSGGFVSVIDTGAISDLTLHKQLYGSEYSGTLSSVLEMHTRMPEDDKRHGEISLGYAGAGFLVEQSIGRMGTTMTQVRHSVVNYLTNDIGIDGVPEYASVLNTSTFAFGAHDTIKTLFLKSSDKLTINPNQGDDDDPTLLNTVFSGGRTTEAVTWHHDGANGGADLQLNYAGVDSRTNQVDVYNDNAPVYSDNLKESPVTLRYDSWREAGRVRVQGGFTVSRKSIDYAIDQAQGFPSPYSMDPTPVDASNIAVDGSHTNAAVYGEGTARLVGSLELQAGLRYESWGINHSDAWMPRVGLKLGLGKRAFLFGGIGSYSEMPSLPTMLGVASNIALKPIRNVQTQLGFNLVDKFGGHFRASVYGRDYSDYPVSTEFASLSLADVIDPFGQPYLYMPMVSAGKGKVLGYEAQYETDMKRRVFGQVNVTSRSVQHEALDGVWRRANYDMPIMANLLGGYHLTRRQVLTGRYSFHTGTPYTPFDVAASWQQNREIYDMTQINAQRGSSYARLDLRYEINLPLAHKNLKIFAGMENVLGRNNFYQYVMLLRSTPNAGPYALTQMGRYMDGGMSWTF